MEKVLDLIPLPTGPLVIPLLDPSHRLPSDLFLSLVLPTFNEAENIEPMLCRLEPILQKSFPGRFEVIVVDDNSPDKTWEVSLLLMERFPWLRVIRREEEKGLASAVIRGWQASRGNILGVMDADLQHPPEILENLCEQIQTADLTVASRNVEGGGVSEWALKRRSVSKIAHGIGAVLLPEVFRKVSDPLSGFFLARRQALENIPYDPKGYKILIEVLARTSPVRIKEAGYIFQERKIGKSKINAKVCWEYILHLLKLRFRPR